MLEQRAHRETESTAGATRVAVGRFPLERVLGVAIVVLLAVGVAAAESKHPGTPGGLVAAGALPAPGDTGVAAGGVAGVGRLSGDAAAVGAPFSGADGGPSTVHPDGEVAEPVLRLASVRSSPPVVWPADGPLTGWFGEVRGRRLHEGIDIFAAVGAPVRAATGGTVVVATTSAPGYGGYGTIAMIDQGDGVSTLYAHLSALHVVPGARVNAGDHIGAVGMTGAVTAPHLHFEVRVGANKVDPADWLASSGAGHRARYGSS